MVVTSGEATLRKKDTSRMMFVGMKKDGVAHAQSGSKTPPTLGVPPYAEFERTCNMAERDGCAPEGPANTGIWPPAYWNMAFMRPQVLSSTALGPSTQVTQISQFPLRSDTNAIWLPSGDQDGE